MCLIIFLFSPGLSASIKLKLKFLAHHDKNFNKLQCSCWPKLQYSCFPKTVYKLYVLSKECLDLLPPGHLLEILLCKLLKSLGPTYYTIIPLTYTQEKKVEYLIPGTHSKT